MRDEGAKDAWQTLQPMAQSLGHLVSDCPISDDERRFLALIVAGHFFGVACGVFQATGLCTEMDDAEMAAVVAKQIVTIMRSGGGRPN